MALYICSVHGLRTPREEIAFTARPKIQFQSQNFRYGRSIFCLPHRPKFSDFFDLCLHWVSVVRAMDIEEISFTGMLWYSFEQIYTVLKKSQCRPWDYILTWSIKKKAHVYSAGAKYCDLCLSEKTIIMLADKNCLNIRSEILRKCPHIRKFTLALVKP